MKMSRVDAIANAVLYEGYMLYPYRPSAIKNQQRFNFGVVAPETKAKSPMSSELSCVRTECLLQGTENSTVDIEVRFLQLVQRDVEVPRRGESRSASVGGGEFQRKDLAIWRGDGRLLDFLRVTASGFGNNHSRTKSVTARSRSSLMRSR